MAIDIEQWDKDYLAAWNTRDLDTILSFFADDCINEDVVVGKINNGKEELRAFLKDLYAGFPDLRLEKKSFFASGDRACTEWIMSGTHSGNWSSLPATGKSFSIRGVSVIELSESKVKRQTDYYDGASLMLQLGLIPPIPQK